MRIDTHQSAFLFGGPGTFLFGKHKKKSPRERPQGAALGHPAPPHPAGVSPVMQYGFMQWGFPLRRAVRRVSCYAMEGFCNMGLTGYATEGDVVR